jgi:hypothetical protein
MHTGMDDSRNAPEQSAIEQRIARSFEDENALGRPLSRRQLRTRRSVEAYLKAGIIPRYMERLSDIDSQTKDHKRRLARAYRALEDGCGGDAELFEHRWCALAQSWSFKRLNELIREHNEWYPAEADLPIDLRTRDYVLIRGRSYRRTELGPDWVLEQFPASRAYA